jgi:hypothetical protein
MIPRWRCLKAKGAVHQVFRGLTSGCIQVQLERGQYFYRTDRTDHIQIEPESVGT